MHVLGLWKEPREPKQTQGEQCNANSTQTGPKPGIEPTTFLQLGSSANHCATLLFLTVVEKVLLQPPHSPPPRNLKHIVAHTSIVFAASSVILLL